MKQLDDVNNRQVFQISGKSHNLDSSLSGEEYYFCLDSVLAHSTVAGR
jgi:YHS domain-containing protein